MWDRCYEKLCLCNMHVLFHVAWELHKQVQTTDRCHQLVYAVLLWSLELSVKHTRTLCNSHFWLNHWIFTQISISDFFPRVWSKVSYWAEVKSKGRFSHSLLQPWKSFATTECSFSTLPYLSNYLWDKNRTINHVSHWWLLYAFSMNKKIYNLVSISPHNCLDYYNISTHLTPSRLVWPVEII